MTDGFDLEQKQREAARWRVLRVLDAGRPISVSDAIIWRVLNDIQIPFSMNQVRRELTYLRDLHLVELEDRDADWTAKLTASGVDVVEYTIPAPPGIARPRKYW
jgi:hypothetical protein